MDALKCSQCGLVDWQGTAACERCGAALQPAAVATEPLPAAQPTAPQYIPPYVVQQAQPLAQRSPYQCWKCGGLYMQDAEQPNRGTGCIVALIGLLFAPFCLGIPIMIYGFMMMGETKYSWVCRSCGMRLPAS